MHNIYVHTCICMHAFNTTMSKIKKKEVIIYCHSSLSWWCRGWGLVQRSTPPRTPWLKGQQKGEGKGGREGRDKDEVSGGGGGGED